MRRVLYSWIGSLDIKLARVDKTGALAATLLEPALELTEAHLLRDIQPGDDLFSLESLEAYVAWLRRRAPGISIALHDLQLANPMHFQQIFASVKGTLEQTAGPEVSPTFNLSSGTSAMAAVWILLGRGSRPARLTNSSPEAGVVEAEVPFDVYADFVPDLLRAADRALVNMSEGRAAGAFSDIVHRSRVMADLIARAERVARRDIPVLILGESGTGKELFARGIHEASPRARKPFQVVNCGAIPKDLVESTLFGHTRGAFTGADREQAGVFELADGGTLFLDEIGELPPAAQAKLLRTLQDGTIQRVGAPAPKRVDVRVVAATHRDVAAMAADGSFRDDLYYRLAVAVLRIPPLRERRGDVPLLIDKLLQRIDHEARRTPGYEPRPLSPGARRKLTEHGWPGNVRELQNTLLRATVWATGDTIQADDVEILSIPAGPSDGILDRPLGDGLSVKELVDDVRRHYLVRALREARGRKVEAGKLIGIGRQSVTDWMSQLELSSDGAE